MRHQAPLPGAWCISASRQANFAARGWAVTAASGLGVLVETSICRETFEPRAWLTARTEHALGRRRRAGRSRRRPYLWAAKPNTPRCAAGRSLVAPHLGRTPCDRKHQSVGGLGGAIARRCRHARRARWLRAGWRWGGRSGRVFRRTDRRGTLLAW